jgi:hypothetical protein
VDCGCGWGFGDDGWTADGTLFAGLLLLVALPIVMYAAAKAPWERLFGLTGLGIAASRLLSPLIFNGNAWLVIAQSEQGGRYFFMARLAWVVSLIWAALLLILPAMRTRWLGNPNSTRSGSNRSASTRCYKASVESLQTAEFAVHTHGSLSWPSPGAQSEGLPDPREPVWICLLVHGGAGDEGDLRSPPSGCMAAPIAAGVKSTLGLTVSSGLAPALPFLKQALLFPLEVAC